MFYITTLNDQVLLYMELVGKIDMVLLSFINKMKVNNKTAKDQYI